MFDAVRSKSMTPVTAEVRQYRFVEIVAGEIQECNAAGQDSVGISLMASPAGNQDSIAVAMLDGSIVTITAGAAIASGAALATDIEGRADDTAVGANVRYLGYALESASAAGEQIAMDTSKSAGHSQN